MTVHTIRISAEKPDGVTEDELRTAVEEWVSSHEEALAPERVTVNVVENLHPAPPHAVGEFRFANTEGKRQLLDETESLLQNLVSWYVLRHHWCPHDEAAETRGGCSWDETAMYGAVPTEVAP